MARIALVSDTHGLLRPELLAALPGADRILHAGDVGGPHVLDALRAIAPVDAVRGNNDVGPWAEGLPETLRIPVEGAEILVIHEVARADPRDARVVVYGHSHRPEAALRDGRWWVNPGSAGPRRFRLPVAMAWLTVEGWTIAVEDVRLEVATSRR